MSIDMFPDSFIDYVLDGYPEGVTTRAPKDETVTKPSAPSDKKSSTAVSRPDPARLAKDAEKRPPKEEPDADLLAAEAPPVDKPKGAKCGNHPDRDGHLFTGGGSFNITLCDECTPPWFEGTE